MDVYLTHLGCRLNESEIEELAWRFAERGHSVVDDPTQATLCVVNTCTVTGEAGRKSRQMVRRLARLNPAAPIAVTGCHATVAPGEVTDLPNVAWVVSNDSKDRLVDLITPPTVAPPEPNTALRHLSPGTLGRTRAFVKVQDGCDNRCTFCITTIARGVGRSRPRDQVVTEVRELVKAGFQEVVLTGVHLGSFGHDLGEQDGLFRLVEATLDQTPIPRLRLSSLEPWDLTPGFFDLWVDARLCRQLHLPLQSGCDVTLRRMARRIRTGEFSELAASARARIPNLALTTDIIVGFPGETDQEFQASYDFVEAMEFSRLHVFSYSPRPGTPAAAMSGQVPAETTAFRSRAMRRLGARQARAFHKGFVGQTLSVLWESRREDGVWRGHTDNYLSVTTACVHNLANRITKTRLLEATGQSLQGEVIHYA